MLDIMLLPTFNVLYFYISTFQSMFAVSHVDVFCRSFILCFPGMLLRYFLIDFETIPVVLIIAGITFVFTYHMYCIFIVYFRIFSSSFLIIIVTPEIASSINIHVPFLIINCF